MKAFNLQSLLQFPLSTLLENEDNFHFHYLNHQENDVNIHTDTISMIKIPLIQRDYAQGRESNSALRMEFIKYIFEYLEEGKELKLDFIYGSIIRENGKLNFLPLDGQQRLTTLYLVHWYIINKEAGEEYNREYLSRFSYETRDTARRFFQHLQDFEFVKDVKGSIENAYWFSDYFRLDPTIESVLNALETIEKRYEVSYKKGSLITNLKNIVFYVLPMDQFKLTDDLYIKLNARGKVLSPFENLKVDLIDRIKNEPYFNPPINPSNELTRYDEIANKFDNKWTHLFWEKAKSKEGKKSIDTDFFRFVQRFFINEYITGYQNSSMDILKNPTYVEYLSRELNPKYQNLSIYSDVINLESLKKIENVLDFYSNHYVQLKSLLTPGWDENYKFDIFKEDTFSMNERMLFDGINEYASNNNTLDIERFKDWVRIVWNIISDPDIRSIGAYKNAMAFLREIGKFSSDILTNLSKGLLDDYFIDNKNIFHLQLKEEKDKAILFLDSRLNWKEPIIKAESHKILQGNISIFLEIVDQSHDLHTYYSRFTKLFSNNSANELIPNEEYTLMRYILSTIKEWHLINNNFNFSSNNQNWRTYLRRNATVKKAVQELLKLESDLVNDYILQEIYSESVLESDYPSEKIAHKNLYYDNTFHKWMQNDGVSRIKWLGHHYFAIRPSAWYSKVMLDCYRNEIITELIKAFSISHLNNHRCADSNYYWGEQIEINKIIENFNISFIFDNNKSLYIGLKTENNLWLKNQEAGEIEENLWIEKPFVFDYSVIKEADSIGNFPQNILNIILSTTYCLFKDKLQS